MRMLLAALSAVLSLLVISPAFAMTPDELAARLQKSYDRTTDLTADFRQISEVMAMHIVKEGSGRLTIRKPGLLRYSYDKPDRQEILVRGDELLLYMPGLKQAIKRKLDRAMLDRTPTTFLAGLGRITDSFTPSYPEAGSRDGDGNHLLMLKPKGGGMGIKHIVLTIKPDTYDILGFSFTDSSGNVNTVRLSNIRTNTGVNSSAFDITLPKDTKIIAE